MHVREEFDRFGGFVNESPRKVIISPVARNNRFPDSKSEETFRDFLLEHLYDLLYDIHCFG